MVPYVSSACSYCFGKRHSNLQVLVQEAPLGKSSELVDHRRQSSRPQFSLLVPYLQLEELKSLFISSEDFLTQRGRIELSARDSTFRELI
ncbi:hypothetical protein OPV22_029639 [Ensete ventricosum]|uniref:Uncharacterized protein n=1 Tax=Ensete ventricosum TaxID=4639 RepID=A0AAV8P578_ENSVE|nr:hypothetical protein OPV22_029639 [Ensete ventricosum]